MLTHGEVVQGVGDAVAALPGVTVGGTSPFSVPVIDLGGNMLWRARLTGAGITAGANDYAMFYGRTANDLQMWLQRGGAEPSGTLPGVTVNYLSTQWDNPRLAAEGGILLFGSTLAGAGVSTANDYCMFYGPIGSMQVLAREGGAVPSPVGAIISANIAAGHDATALNASGTALIKVNISGGGVTPNLDDTGWLIGTPGNLSWMCRENDLLPGGALAVHSVLDGFRPCMDAVGRVIFSQSLSLTNGSTPATAANNDAILLYTPGSGLSVLVREGDLAPGSGACSFGTINSASGFCYHGLSRANGFYVFTNSMTLGDVSGPTNDHAVFAGQIGGALTRVARESEPAPTGVPGEIYQALFPNGTAQINDRGTVVFISQLNTGLPLASDTAVFLGRPPYGPGDVQMILREGQTVAGLPAGWVVGNTTGGGLSATGTTWMLNDDDTVLINVAGVGDPTAASWGVPAQIAWDPQHGARLAAMQGETYTIQASAQVMSAAVGTVARSSSDGGNLSFNAYGDQASRVFFTGTVPTAIMRNHVGSFVAKPSSVPAAGGTAHAFAIDCGVANANQFYIVLASSLGTRPGFLSPLGPQTIPLNFDPTWSQLSLDLMNSPVWTNTFWFTDANGRATASFNLPTGIPGLLGTRLHHAAVLFDLSLVSNFVTEPSGVRLY
jgi:hypothetical protein